MSRDYEVGNHTVGYMCVVPTPKIKMLKKQLYGNKYTQRTLRQYTCIHIEMRSCSRMGKKIRMKACYTCGIDKPDRNPHYAQTRWSQSHPERTSEEKRYVRNCMSCCRIMNRRNPGIGNGNRVGIIRYIARAESCECCGIKFKSNMRGAIDHCHDTGNFRGALCHRCNMAIGSLGDSVEGLNRAVSYLSQEYPVLQTCDKGKPIYVRPQESGKD